MSSVVGDVEKVKRMDSHSFKIDEVIEYLMQKIYRGRKITELIYENGRSKLVCGNFELVFSEGRGAFYHLYRIESPVFNLFCCRFAGQATSDEKILDYSLPYWIEIKPLNLKIDLYSSGMVCIEKPGKIPKGYEKFFYLHWRESNVLSYCNIKKECFGIQWYKEHEDECKNDINFDTMYLSAACTYVPIWEEDNERVDDFLKVEERKDLSISWTETEREAIEWIEGNIVPIFT